MEFSVWLFEHYLSWQSNLGKRKSLSDFAAWVGVSQPVISNYLNGKREPGEDNAYLFYLKFGEEIYEVLDMEPPDFLLRYVRASWHLLPDDAKEKIKDIIIISLDETGERLATEQALEISSTAQNY